jgi:NADPH2:quinone reductase
MNSQLTMQAALLEAHGAPFRRVTVARPIAGAGEALVRVAASGVNPLDLKIREGVAGHARQKLPAILGIDMAGTVVATGPGVTRLRPGDEVFGMTGGVGGHQGSLAEYAAVDADLLALKPANFSMREASVVPLVFITAWEGLVDRMAVGGAGGPDRAGSGRGGRRRPDGDPNRPRPRRRRIRDRLGIEPADDRGVGGGLRRSH